MVAEDGKYQMFIWLMISWRNNKCHKVIKYVCIVDFFLIQFLITITFISFNVLNSGHVCVSYICVTSCITPAPSMIVNSKPYNWGLWQASWCSTKSGEGEQLVARPVLWGGYHSVLNESGRWLGYSIIYAENICKWKQKLFAESIWKLSKNNANILSDGVINWRNDLDTGFIYDVTWPGTTWGCAGLWDRSCENNT